MVFTNNLQNTFQGYIEAANYRFSVNESVINFLNNSLRTVETNVNGLKAEIVGYTRHMAVQDEISADLRGEIKRLTDRIMALIRERDVVQAERWNTVHTHMEVVKDWLVFHDVRRLMLFEKKINNCFSYRMLAPSPL